MTSSTIIIVREEPEHQPEIDILTADAFGPGRFARTAFRLRENVPHRRDLSFVALVENGRPVPELAGSVVMTDILIGEKPALLLGPLVVSPYHQKIGIGRELMNRSMREWTPAIHRM